jgi:hypothetical protein
VISLLRCGCGLVRRSAEQILREYMSLSAKPFCRRLGLRPLGLRQPLEQPGGGRGQLERLKEYGLPGKCPSFWKPGATSHLLYLERRAYTPVPDGRALSPLRFHVP